MENRKRSLHLHVMVTAEEMEQIRSRMAEAGISNTGAYVRKMALNGYILHVDLAPVKRTGFLAAALLQQSQSGSHTRPHLRRVPGRNRRTAKGL